MVSPKKIQDLTPENEFRDSWNLENAMYILQHPTVDSKVWAEAVEWLLLHGPKEIQEILLSSSQFATQSEFPKLKITKFSTDGTPCYDIDELAEALGITKEEAKEIIDQKERSHGVRHGFDDSESCKIQ